MTFRPLLIGALSLVLACGGDDGGNTPTGPTPDFTFSVAPATLTIVVGESGDYTVSVTRTGGFTGRVSVSIPQLPSGVTAATLSIEEGQTSGSLTIDVAPSSVPGVFELTVRASASGVGQKATDATLVTRIVA